MPFKLSETQQCSKLSQEISALSCERFGKWKSKMYFQDAHHDGHDRYRDANI